MVKMKKNSIYSILFFFISVILLFLGFYRNQWQVVLRGKFRNFQLDSQSLVMGRLVESRQNGVFSHGGLLGRGDVDPFYINEEGYTYQYDAYLKLQQSFEYYDLYKSQSGFQGILFSILDKLSPNTPHENLRVYRVFVSLSLAVLLGVLLVWFLQELGFVAAVFALITTIASPWLTLFGRNLFYFIAFLYLPIVALTCYLHLYSKNNQIKNAWFGLVVFITVCLKCLFNGYDFILPAIASNIMPFTYFAFREGWQIHEFIKKGIVITMSTALAITVSLAVLTTQISIATGNFSESFTYISDTFNRRTLGDPEKYPEYAVSLEAKAWDVVVIYLNGDSAIAQANIKFIDLILMFAILTGIYFAFEKRLNISQDMRTKVRAFAIATWISILSPLLWFIIFKGQSYVHTHTNFLSWYLPFTICGFALCGVIIQNLFMAVWRKQQKLKVPYASQITDD